MVVLQVSLSGCQNINSLPKIYKEIYLNRVVKPFKTIKRQVSKIGGCHLAFSPSIFVQGGRLNSDFSWKVKSSEFSPRLKLPPIIWVKRPISTPLFNPALRFVAPIWKNLSTPIHWKICSWNWTYTVLLKIFGRFKTANDDVMMSIIYKHEPKHLHVDK